MYVLKGGEGTVVDVFVVKENKYLVLSWCKKESCFGLGFFMSLYGSIS